MRIKHLSSLSILWVVAQLIALGPLATFIEWQQAQSIARLLLCQTFLQRKHPPTPRDKSGAIQSGPYRWGERAPLKKGLTK